MVDDQRITATWSRSDRKSPKPRCARAASRMSTNAIVTSWGVVSTLRATTLPSPLTRPSVIVPPVSMSTLYMADRSLHRAGAPMGVRGL
jgi:hypothetical protein